MFLQYFQRATSTALSTSFLSESINFVHLSKHVKHLLHILPSMVVTNGLACACIPFCSSASSNSLHHRGLTCCDASVDNNRFPFALEMSLPQPMQIIVIDTMLETIIDTTDMHVIIIRNVLAQYFHTIITFLLHKYAMQESSDPFIF